MSSYTDVREAAEGATPGPWVTREHLLHDHDRWGQLMEIYNLQRREEALPFKSKSPDVYGPDEECIGDEPIIQVITNPPKDRCKADAHFIATANPQKVLEILDALRVAEKERDELRERGISSTAMSVMTARLEAALAREAALRSQLDEAREALKPFAVWSKIMTEHELPHNERVNEETYEEDDHILIAEGPDGEPGGAIYLRDLRRAADIGGKDG